MRQRIQKVLQWIEVPWPSDRSRPTGGNFVVAVSPMRGLIRLGVTVAIFIGGAGVGVMVA